MRAERAIKVFVSSTFRDMQAERDELVKRTFPAVRRLCQQRDVAWSEVDLRWGVTDEQKAEGAVLPICLAEIERSRPYFIGILGQRYGWVPDDSGGRSVTELEVLHGVLDHPVEERHALFYLRDVDPDPAEEGWEKLEALKARVRASGHPVRDYADPITLGRLVLADLTALVDRVFPAAEVPDPRVAETAIHQAAAAARTVGFVDRPALTAAIDAGSSPLLVTGEPGAGASTLVAAWAGARSGPVVFHDVGATAASSDWKAMVRRLVDGLGGSTDAADPTSLRAALAAALAAASPGTVVVVDGVDQLDDVDGALELSWLPPSPPSQVRIVLTGPGGRPLDAARGRGWPVLEVPPLDDGERRGLVAAFLGRFAKGLDRVHVDRLAAAPQTGNALFLRVVLDELRQHGDHFTLSAVIDHLLTATTVDDLLELVFARYEQDFERDRPGLVRDAFSALWAARKGLSESELLAVLGSGAEPLPHAAWAPLFLAAEDGLVTRSGNLGFATEHHRRAVADRYGPGPDVHGRLAAFFAGEPLGPRVVDELPWQQLAAGDVDGLVATIADLAFTDVAYRRSFPDLRRLWTRAEEAGRSVVQGYRPVVDDPVGFDPDLVWAVARLVTDAGYPTEAARLHRSLVDRTEGATRRAALVNLGAALWAQGEREAAVAPLREAADASRAAGDDVHLAAALGNLVLVHRDLGDLAAAEKASAEEEQVCRRLGDLNGLQAALGNRAAVVRQRGDLDGALELMVEQEALCRELGDRAGVARAQAARGAVLGDRGEHELALPLFEAHAAFAREDGDLTGLAESLVSQAATLAQLGRLDAAEGVGAEAEAPARRLGDLGLVARVLVARATAAAVGGRWADAARRGREAVLAAKEAGTPAVVPMALNLVGMALREQGDVEGAAAAHAEQHGAAISVGDAAAVAVAECGLATIDITLGRLQDALAHYAAAEPVLRDLGLADNLLPLLANRAQVHAHLGDVDRAVADYRTGAAIAPTAQRHQMLTAAVELLYGAGRPAEAEPVWVDLAPACRELGDDAGLQRALGERALLLIGRGDLDTATALLDEQEAICRRTDDAVGLAACVGNRAIVLRQRGDLDGALACVDEQAAVARASGNGQGVLFATANRGDILGAMGRRDEAVAALREARQMAAGWNLTPMVAQLDQMIAALQP